MHYPPIAVLIGLKAHFVVSSRHKILKNNFYAPMNTNHGNFDI